MLNISNISDLIVENERNNSNLEDFNENLLNDSISSVYNYTRQMIKLYNSNCKVICKRSCNQRVSCLFSVS